jgi:hypothetical protein
MERVEIDSWKMSPKSGQMKERRRRPRIPFANPEVPMILKRLILAVALLAIAVACAAAQEPAGKTDKKTPEAIARVAALLDAMIETKHFHDEMPLAKFLSALEGALPPKDRITLRVDEKAFGKELPNVLAASVRLPAVPKRMTLHTALRLAISNATNEDTDFAISPAGILITSPRLAASSITYNVRDVIDRMPRLRPSVIEYRHYGDVFSGIDPTDGAALLVRLLANDVTLYAWESIQVQNDSRLIALACPRHHHAIADLLAAVRRMDDLAVVMNARLYEVDRRFFAKHISGLLVGEEPPEGLLRPGTRIDDRPVVIPIEAPLLAKLMKQKLVLESDDIKIRPGEKAVFLAHQTLFQFDAGIPLGKRLLAIGTGLAGVRLAVQPTVSPDRRFLRLQISQHITRLEAINKGKQLDATMGNEREIDVPAICEFSATGTVQIPDGDPFLMPVDYRPPGKEHADKVWLLVARPVIWIQEEQDRVKAGDEPPVRPKSIWESPTSKEVEEAIPPSPEPPLTDDVKEILQLVITDVLTNPQLKDMRALYGTAKDRTLAFKAGSKWSWPKELNPGTSGFQIVTGPGDPFERQRRVLGLRLDAFAFTGKRESPTEAEIEIALVNAGGSDNGGVIGVCRLSYVARRVGKRWSVHLDSLATN